MNAIEQARKFSPFLCRILDNGLLEENELSNIIEKPFQLEMMQNFANWQEIQNSLDTDSLYCKLRKLRLLVIAHIIIRDLTHLSTLSEVMQTISTFADFAVNQATDFSHAYYVDFYGKPIGKLSGKEQYLSVIAMGKMGGFELNVSSDIDLIFIYPENGETNGKKSYSNQEFFTKVGKKIISILNDITADGQVFRVDMRLRPDGDSGALVLSEAALEQYLILHGREWERYAWIKARIATPYENGIKELVRPFVYRKYLDFSAYESIRNLHKQICNEVNKRGMENNIKLGSGGIREIEFIVQIFQLIRGGRNKSLQLKGTQEALLSLSQQGLLEKETTNKLLEIYHFLRNIEHRLQYWEDQQTQSLPETTEQQQLLAQSMEFNDYNQFIEQLNNNRKFVNYTFHNVFGEPEKEAPLDNSDKWKNIWDNLDSDLLTECGFIDADNVIKRLEQLRNSGKYNQLSQRAINRFNLLMPRILEVSTRFAPSERTLFRLLDLIEAVMRRSSYMALLYEYPEALERVARIMSQSLWASEYLMRHPILLDELLSSQLLDKNIYANIEKELAEQLSSANGDVEEEMNILRHYQHSHIFRLSVQDLENLWTIEAISDELSALSDVILRQALNRAWVHFPKKHDDNHHFAIIAYGKLGGKELGYDSDLDLVYLYNDNHPDAINTYTRLSNRLTSWLSANTSAGGLYNVDLRLRPNGEAGFSATSIDAFCRYQNEQAWTWEHQALSRARFVCGDEQLGELFEKTRQNILMQVRDLEKLRQDIINMREKMFATHPPVNDNVKYARGGIVDVEFIVQYLVLGYSHQYPDLTKNYGNIALLRMAAEFGLIDSALSQSVQSAYREYRRIQHNIRLRDITFVCDDAILQAYAQVKLLWRQVFNCEI
ncbi:MAG: bifunctional [Neisseriaceae bacterium]|nr:bifunctional [glutamate--ammonia ligase]-adenylyl-L-tyrosine phosphorylase/[glutamate--ammonia-ligase] adenylyltransferase [Neisseriaceae bacterium]